MQAKYKQKLGIIGGGQLGRMMANRALLLGFKVCIYANSTDCCAISFADEYTIGSYDDYSKILEFCNKCDYITTEFENISPLAIINSKFNGFNALAIYTSQHRMREKSLAKNLGIPTASFKAINNMQDASSFFAQHGKCIIKTTTMGYDGKGQFVVKCQDDIQKIPQPYFNATCTDDSKIDVAIQDLVKSQFKTEGFDYIYNTNLQSPLIAESFVDYKLELSVICTRFNDGKIVFFPSPINTHKNGILHTSRVSWVFNFSKAVKRARLYTGLIANKLNFVGTITVEFFLTKNGEVIFNEIAPRPHNSGHYTMDLCNICQFESHVRAVCGLAPIEPRLLHSGFMLNLIGNDIFELTDKHIANANATIHLYGKKINPDDNIDGRKLGHINIRLKIAQSIVANIGNFFIQIIKSPLKTNKISVAKNL